MKFKQGVKKFSSHSNILKVQVSALESTLVKVPPFFKDVAHLAWGRWEDQAELGQVCLTAAHSIPLSVGSAMAPSRSFPGAWMEDEFPTPVSSGQQSPEPPSPNQHLVCAI